MAYLSACAIFLGALLLFLVQPMMGKMILPWFGGTPAVWTTCMLFFQLLLLGGYAYAAALVRVRGLRRQVALHVLLLAIGVCLLPITPGEQWKPLDGQQPALRILIMLAACVGWPYFLLSATSPLVQSWFASRFPHRSPYRLYALSNAGSLGALLAYPFLIEPMIGTNSQGWCWSIAYGLFVVVIVCLFWQLGRQSSLASEPPARMTEPQPSAPHRTQADHPPTISQRAIWLGFSALASTMLLALTNHLCQDVAVVPFLWIAPLALYLVSLIICFERDRWYWPGFYSLLGMVTILLASDLAYVTYVGSQSDMLGNRLLTQLRFNLVVVISIYLSLFFCVCMLCHGEIVRRRPSTAYLTEFYLIISAGGALGGVIVALACPLLFTTFAEMNIGLVICFALCTFVFLRDVLRVPWLTRNAPVGNAVDRKKESDKHKSKKSIKPRNSKAAATKPAPNMMETIRQSRILRTLTIALCGVLLVIVIVAQSLTIEPSTTVMHIRNFYGTLTVREWTLEASGFQGRAMYHGNVLHGFQSLEEGRQFEPMTYYTRESGIGLAFSALRNDTPPGTTRSLRVGAVGLGIGTIAAYGQSGDEFRFYEINDDVIELARSSFSFLSNCQSNIDIVPGDARLSLERESPQAFDLLVLDAFSGDAIPVHLITRQAIEIYLRHLQRGGLIAIHTTNRHVDLRPVIRQLAVDQNLYMSYIEQAGAVYMEASPSEWVILAREPSDLARPELRQYAFAPQRDDSIPIWTDDRNNLFQVLRWY